MEVLLWVWILVGGVIGGAGYNVAKNKGLNAGAWFVCCFLLPPVILILLSMAPLESAQLERRAGAKGNVHQQNTHRGDATKTCPQCAETVKAAAKICRFCRYEFPLDAVHPPADFPPPWSIEEHKRGSYYNRGLWYLDNKDYDRAIAEFTEAIRQNPKLAAPYKKRADAYRAKGEVDRATADLDQAHVLTEAQDKWLDELQRRAN
jgi:tetratricopeptide (TPR) repeat protein